MLISQRADDVRDREREWDSDTESVGGASDVEVKEVVETTVAEIPVVMEARVRAPVRAFASLDAVNLVDLFDDRARVMRSVPHVLKGAFRMALRVAFQEIFDGTEANSEARVVRGWKLFLLLPRMLLFRPLRGGVVPRKKLESRIRQFQEVSGSHSCATALPAVRWPTLREIVVGDILRRFVARTIAKQIAKKVEAATAPFAFLDDVYITNQPGRVTEARTVVEEELWTHAGIRLHHGKT